MSEGKKFDNGKRLQPKGSSGETQPRKVTFLQSEVPQFPLVSLFAGAGGLDVGLETAGFTTVFATDLESHCCETLRANQQLGELSPAEFDWWFKEQINRQRCYKNNSPEEIERTRVRVKQGLTHQLLREASIVEGDIRQIPSDQILRRVGFRSKDVFLVAGGPPCQPFSRAGKRETVAAEDGKLFLEFVRVVRDLRPRWFLFENVKGLLFAKTEVVRLHCSVCRAKWLPPFSYRNGEIEGMSCSCGSKRFGVQHCLERGGSLDLILSEFERQGYRCSWRVLNAADFGAPQLRERLFIVGTRDNEKFIWPEPHFGTNSANGEKAQLDLFAAQVRPWRTLLETLWPNGHPKYGNLDPEQAVLWVKNVVRPHAEPVTWRLDRPCPTVGAHQAAKFALAPYGVPESQLRRQQWHTKGQRQGDLPPVPVEHHYLSDSELLLLQTFPEGWYLHGTRMQRAFQIGNAVPSVLGQSMGLAILAASGCRQP